jgi:hypothetical protein
MVTPLCELAFKYKTDKCIQIRHDYTPIYYNFLKERRLSVKKVFEMGIGFKETMAIPGYVVGASLRMWRDFFPNATIYGADIDPRGMFKDDRIETFLCDQSNEESLRSVIEKTGVDIDVFIDDGSHRIAHQILTIQTLMPLFKKDIFYAIEDVIKTKTIPRKLPQYDFEVFRPVAKNGFVDGMLIVKHKP